MKIAFLTFLACVLAANAAYLPQRHGVTAQDIDILVSDAVHFYRSWIIKNQPLKTTDIGLVLKNSNLDLKANLKDLEGWLIHEHAGSSYSESSSMSDHDLFLSVLVGQSGIEYKGKLELDGTLNGKPFEKTGSFKLKMKSVGTRLNLKAEFTPKSFKLVDFHYAPEFSSMDVEISGFDVDQATKGLIEKSVKQSVEDAISKGLKDNEKNTQAFIAEKNKLAEGHNLQEVYDYLRGMVPRTGNGPNSPF